MKIAVLGAGAMGQLFGAHLAVAGHDVVMIDVSEDTCEQINRCGINVDMDTHQVHAVTNAALAPHLTEEVNLLFVMTKGPHTRAALSSVRHLIADDTIGLTLQNGLGNEEPLLEYFGEDQVVIGMTDYPADRHQDGTISSEPSGHIIVGEISPTGRVIAQQVAKILAETGLTTTHSVNVKIPIWEKVIFNTVYNTISAATGLKVGGVFGEPEASILAYAVLDESLRVAKRENIDINEARLRKNIKSAHENHSEHKTSMLADLDSGRPTEIEAIGGAVEKIGHKHNLAVPYLSILCDIIRLRERAARL